MEKNTIYILFLLSTFIAVFTLYKLDFFRLTGYFIGFREPEAEFEWWNASWHYRMKLEINSSQYSRADWPIEKQINFTDLLPSGTLDDNSIRVIEYNSSGLVLYEIPSQFDKDESYDSTSNAIGTLVFLLNGTTPENTIRYFEVYYDTTEVEPKSLNTYNTDLIYNNDSLSVNGEFSVNNTYYRLIFDTSRGENTSGFYHAEASPQLYIGDLTENDKTFEYLQYSNGTNNFMFDLRNKANFLSTGPIRIVVEQTGDESLWGYPDSITEKGKITKKYIFYKNNTWIKIIQNFTNTDSSSINRNSTEAGTLAFDASRAWSSGYKFGIGTDQENETVLTDNTWGWASSAPLANGIVGIINVNQTGTANFSLANSSSLGRIGIQLNSTDVNARASIIQTTVFYFNGTWYPNGVEDLRNNLINPAFITSYLPETWYNEIIPNTNSTIYNRNETLLLAGNVSFSDSHNLTKYMNATFDMGTVSQVDDQTIILYDDGTNGDENSDDKIFTNTFGISNDATLGIWTINFTTYTEDSEFLNSTSLNFNVTDILNVTINVTNKKPIGNSVVISKIYLKNYRQDSWVSGATINCIFDSTEVINKTDYNNGTYSINFTSSTQEGNYNLVCNATKNGNFGNNTDNFTTEAAKTYINTTVEPSNPTLFNVSLYYDDSFEINANATNVGNGTAYKLNITLELLNDWISDYNLKECGDLEKSTYCIKGFNITVPNGTSPGNYYINITVIWTNPDYTTSTNKTQVNVTVNSNPRIDVEETKVSGEIGDGTNALISNFTVHSIGNDALQNINFTCISGDVCNNFNVSFVPENIPSLSVGSKYNVSINVTVPAGWSVGTYNGTVNSSAQNNRFDTFILEITVPAKTNVSVKTSITNYTVYNITQQTNGTFSFLANATNIGSGSARFVNISLILPNGWIPNSSVENCGSLIKSSSCYRGFNVTIPKATSSGNYLVYVYSNWTNPDNSLGTNSTSINVTVAPNALINVTETNISETIPDGTEKTVGNFTVHSIGNDALQNINFTCYSEVVCQNFVVEFIPANVSSLAVNLNQSIMVNVTVPVGWAAGTYNGTVNVSAVNDNYDNLTLEVTVPPNRTWTIQQDYCQKSETPPEGVVCEINVLNTGNIYINFTVSPETGNYTRVNETSFTVNAQNSHIFSVTYNVTGIPPQIYNSTFLVDALQTDANPNNKTVRISLVPYIEPIVNISTVPNEAEEQSNIAIFANVTDRSGTNIKWTKVNITKPNGTVDNFNMTKTSENGNLTTWYLLYSLGNTSLKGTYNLTVYTEDNIGNVGIKNTSFLIYTKVTVSISTLADKYYQGDTGSIYYTIRDYNGTGVSNVNVTFIIKDPNQNTTHISYHTSNQDGAILPLPSFSLPSDAPLGYYTLIANSTYYDEDSKSIVRISKNISFQTLSRTVTVTGLFADMETAVVWYPPIPGSPWPVIKFGILTYNAEGEPVDPDYINLTIYEPDNDFYLSATISDMEKQATGFYTYEEDLLANTPTGMYLAVLNATQGQFQTLKIKAFRIASGGPYDLWVDLFENEVQQGGYLDFAVIIENKGEVTQDVYLEWWVSSLDGIKYYQTSGNVRTVALSNETVTKQAYIYSEQGLGTYVLNVKMIFDASQPPLYANETFIVLSKQEIPNITTTTVPVTTTTYPSIPSIRGKAVAPEPEEKILADILIERYGTNISVVKGMTKPESVTVRNTGQADLENITLFILGIPASWFKITPESYKTLKPDESNVFLIDFNIPQNAQEGEYKITLTATSGVVGDQKYATLTIFRSLDELLENELNKIKGDLKELELDIKIAEREGKDVSGVLLYVDEIKAQIDLAEENLEDNKTEDALQNVANAKNLINKARDLLGKLIILKTKEFLPITSWAILIILIIIISISIIVFLIKKTKILPPLRPYIIPLGRIVEKTKEKPKEDLVKEKEKYLRMLAVLEKEKSEGIISNIAYKEMKTSIEEKLKNIEKRLR